MLLRLTRGTLKIHTISEPPGAEILIHEVCSGVRPMQIYLVKAPRAVSETSIPLHLCVCACVRAFSSFQQPLMEESISGPQRLSQRMGFTARQAAGETIRGTWPGLSAAHGAKVCACMGVPRLTNPNCGKSTKSLDLTRLSH